jgi:hypothetical protein
MRQEHHSTPAVRPANQLADRPAESASADSHRRPLESEAMEHVQPLSTMWLHKPAARADQRPESPAPLLLDRDDIRQLAERHHRQLVQAKQRSGSNHETLRAQTDSLRRMTVGLSSEDAEAFMNAYTEESSVVEREWLARHSGSQTSESLNATVVSMLAYVVTIVAIALAIYYAV